MLWTIYQVITLVVLAFCTYAASQMIGGFAASGLETAGPVNSLFDILLAVTIPITAFYFFILFELNKDNHIFYRRIWKRAPVLFGAAGILSLAGLFLLFFQDVLWGEKWAIILLYQYFLLLFYMFVFAVFFKRMKRIEPVTRAGELAATYSVWVVLGVFILSYFVFPAV
ncbi:hypothetical protein [Salibacterium sp. K-3]